MRIFGRHEDLDALLDELLGCTTIEALFDRLLARLEEDFGVASTTLFFSLLGCSESGLSERALTEIGAEIGGITRLDISALLPALDYHLMRQEGRLDFFHDFLRRAVASRYLADSAQETTLRRHIVTVLSHGEVNAWRTREVARQLHALDEKQELGRFLSRPERFLAFIGSGANIEYLQLWQSLDTHVDVVASFADTYDDGPLESSEILPYSRVDYLYRLASFFGTISRWSAAEPLLRRLATLDETERSEQWRCRLLINLGSALFYQHKLAEAEEIYEQAREIAEEIGDLVAERQIIGNLANVYEVLGKPQDARKATDMHLASFAQVRDEPAHARALLLSADLHRAAGEVEQAQGQYDEAIRIARRQDDPQLVCACLGNLAICQKRLGDTDGAMQNFQEVLAISERHGYLQSIATACSQIASIDQRRGNLDEAVTGYERCVAIGQRLDDDKTRRLGLSGLGHIYYHRGEFDRARVIIDETLGIAERMNDPQEISAASTLAGAVCLQIEEPDQALTHFERARQAEEQSGNRYGIGTAIGNIGCVHHARRAYGAALASFAEALEIHRSIEQPEPVIDWLIDRVKVVFDIIGASEDPPEELLGLLSDEPTDDWRNAARTFVGESLDEATQLAEQIEFHHVMPSIAALRERIDEPV